MANSTVTSLTLELNTVLAYTFLKDDRVAKRTDTSPLYEDLRLDRAKVTPFSIVLPTDDYKIEWH
jgi:hypothetical protein